MSFTVKHNPKEKTQTELESGTMQDKLYNRTSEIDEVKEGSSIYKRIKRA